jgi:hypothetical protein
MSRYLLIKIKILKNDIKLIIDLIIVNNERSKKNCSQAGGDFSVASRVLDNS